jgi:sec-independent protein translocase protein TatC
MAAMAATFFWLYSGGLGQIKDAFLTRIPDAVDPGEMTIIALHPVEALIFNVKVSLIAGAVATVPLLCYYVWPALVTRRIATGNRNAVFAWGAAMVLTLLLGILLGFFVIAPAIISYLVADAVAADMVITYRLRAFYWLIFFTTVGVGLLANVPFFMVMLNRAGIVDYETFRTRWREVIVGLAIVAMLLTPGSVIQMLVLTLPLTLAYLIGIGVLWFATLGGRRDPAATPAGTVG